MAKRSTIGVNPLDAQVQDNPLDAVVPSSGALARGGSVAAELADEARERLRDLEAGLDSFRNEIARLRGEMTSLRGDLSLARGEGAQAKAAVLPVKDEVARLQAELGQLKTDLASLRAEVTRLRSAPSDIPWWMGGRKKS